MTRRKSILPDIYLNLNVRGLKQSATLAIHEGSAQLQREAVAAYHRRLHGIERATAGVLIGPGSKELMFILQLVYYGDLVIPTPSWAS